MNKEHIEKLIVALRSGTYKQGKGYLHSADKWCCLGVACDIVKDELQVDWIKADDIITIFKFMHTTAQPPSEIMKIYEFDGDVSQLININDSNDGTFEDVARYLESKI